MKIGKKNRNKMLVREMNENAFKRNSKNEYLLKLKVHKLALSDGH